MPRDAVLAGFKAGSTDWPTPDNDPGQRDLIEKGFSTAAMRASRCLHGGQPDATALCHEPTPSHRRGLPQQGMPAQRDRTLTLTQTANPARVVTGVSVQTRHMAGAAARAALARAEDAMALSATDPSRTGAGTRVEALAAL